MTTIPATGSYATVTDEGAREHARDSRAHQVAAVEVEDSSQWRRRSACATDPNPDRWVDMPPVSIRGRNNPAYDARLRELKDLCQACPVRGLCLREAIRTDVIGVFGGTDEFERADLRERFGVPQPPLMPFPETETDERLQRQRFEIQRLKRARKSNAEIADALGVTPMTVSRFLADPDAA